MSPDGNPPPGSGASPRPVRGALLLLLVLILALLTVLLTVLVGLQVFLDPAPGSGPQTTSSRPAGVPADAQPAVVTRIVDGDTIRVRQPGHLDDERVRLLNLDTPELGRDGQPDECLAQAARDHLATLVAVDSTVWLAADVQDRDRFDRLLRGVWTEQGAFANAELVREGLGVVLLIEPNDRFYAEVLRAEAQARAQRRGLWGDACPDQPRSMPVTTTHPTPAATSAAIDSPTTRASAAAPLRRCASCTASTIAVEKVV